MGFDGRDTQAMTPDGRRGGIVVGLRRTTTSEMMKLEGRRWVLGKNPACDFVIGDDPFVSTNHCVLERHVDTLVVRDSGSRNGTYLDGNRIESAELRVGSYLAVGHTTLIAVSAVDSANRAAVELIRGTHPVLTTAIGHAQRAAATECSVLILGETGTGKDLFARMIHESSKRAAGPYVAVNCGALPRELIASLLFGHEKGAFTGAQESRDGYFVEAHGGTLFLDELGELPLELQAHLLRVLETRKVRRVSGSAERSVDVRIVAATNQAVVGGERVRSDLYHRLATVVLNMPPLRERMSDLGELVLGFLEEHAMLYGAKEVTIEGWDALTRHSWPGNVRELMASVQRAVVFGGPRLGPRDFFPDSGGPTRQRLLTPSMFTTAEMPGDSLAPYHTVLKSSMEQALHKFGTIRAAASAIGMPKSTFADKARAWKIEVRRGSRRKKSA
jgi:DNA-binding NtrC family response regulator